MTDYDIPEKDFNYSESEFLDDMTKFGDRLDSLHDLTTNELRFDKQEIANLRLNRNEMRYYESLQYAYARKNMQEPVYFRNARLITKIEENKQDLGWNYDWRFLMELLIICKMIGLKNS